MSASIFMSIVKILCAGLSQWKARNP